MEAIRSSETSGTTQRTTWRHIPEEDTLHVFLLFGGELDNDQYEAVLPLKKIRACFL
jgi:hypothetical protein